MSQLDLVFPVWHFRERHRTQVESTPEHVFAAVRQVTLDEMGAFRVLARLRGIRAPGHRSIVELALASGWSVLADEPGSELVLGAVGQPWRLRGGADPGGEPATCDRPGYAKLAINWHLQGTTLSTETRVLATDGSARRKFRLYWIAIRPFSGLIRRVWLRAIARRAEALERAA